MHQNPEQPIHLQRTLSTIETWGFGLSGLLLWLGVAPGMQSELGAGAILVWLPGTIVGIILNLQVKRLGEYWPDLAGGTPNYAARLLKHYPGLARYGAIGYWLGWVSVPPMNAIILSDLIQANLEPVGIYCPDLILKIGFTIIGYIVAFSGTRALGILHLCFVIPAIGFLIIFCLQGMGWLIFAPSSPGLFPPSWAEIPTLTSLGFGNWTKWYFLAVYAVLGCETASSFVADSRNPNRTLQCLGFAAWLIPPVYLGGSWVLIRLATDPHLGDNTFLNLLAAATPFWGNSASFLVTFLITAGCLLSSATAVSNSPRILYQLAVDGYLAPVFTMVSRRGVLVPSLIFSLLISFLCLTWGDISRLVMVTGTGYLSSMITIHFGLWLGRGQPQVRWPWWSGCFCLVELVVLLIGGLVWGWSDLLIGLLLPIAVWTTDVAIRRIPWAPFHLSWWHQRQRGRSLVQVKDFVALQVGVLIVLLSITVVIGWLVGINSVKLNSTTSGDLLVVLIFSVAFIGVAIACWTSLPQVAAIVEAREQAEYLFMIALDAILVLDENGVICQINPATEQLCQVQPKYLIGRHLHQLVSGLTGEPDNWPRRSEQNLNQPDQDARIVEVAISASSHRDRQEYVVILRDITDKKKAEKEIYQSLQIQEKLTATATEQTEQLKQTVADLQQAQAQLIQSEKMSSLGQLVAGVAHEINNPVNFIYGNLSHAQSYIEDLLSLIAIYQQYYPDPEPAIVDLMSDIDFEFIAIDLPKILASMKVGAERIRQIVLTLRNFSRLDESQMKPVNIHEGIDSTLMILQNRLKAKLDFPSIAIVKEYSNLPEVECYAGQLNQVFMNILSNAIDALHDHINKTNPEFSPRIWISTQMINAQVVRIIIKDNGLGIKSEILPYLFDPFFTTKPVGSGTGLGLSISYQIIVEKHKGKLECLSQVGVGTEFWIEIPIKQISSRT